MGRRIREEKAKEIMEKVIETDKGAEIKIQSCKLEGLMIKKRIWKHKGEERTKRRKLEDGDEVITN